MSLLDISYVMFARIKPHMHSGDDGFSFADVLGYILVCIVFSVIAWVINKAKNAELEWRKRRKEKKFAKHAVRTVGESKKVSSIWYNQALNENNQTAMKNACNNDNAPMRNIMFCQNCGTSVKADYKFCFKCGMELSKTNETVIEDRTLPRQNQLRQIRHEIAYHCRIIKAFTEFPRFTFSTQAILQITCSKIKSYSYGIAVAASKTRSDMLTQATNANYQFRFVIYPSGEIRNKKRFPIFQYG